MIAALLLAAGSARRFGADKLLAPLGGRPVIRWSADAARAGTDQLLVVVPPSSAAALAAALEGLAAELVPHAGHDAGMGSSLSAGVRALPHDCEAVVVCLADQPLASREVTGRLVARWRETGAPAAAPRYRDGRGHPVLFGRACFTALTALDGEEGARSVLASLGAQVELVDVDDAMPLDVDTPAALAEVARTLAG